MKKQTQQHEVHVQETVNLYQDGQLAAQRKVPLLIIFSQIDCAFCERLKEEVINPMLISGDYTDKVLIREFMIDHDEEITGFNGKSVEAISVFYDYDLYVTPSVLLLDSQGNELAERQIGINTVDYYSYYLDAAIDKARKIIRARP